MSSTLAYAWTRRRIILSSGTMKDGSVSHYLRLSITHQRTTGVPADDQTNTVYAFTDSETRATLINSMGVWFGLWMQHYYAKISPNLFTGLQTYNWYDMADPEPRVPINTGSTTVTPTGGADLMPPEVSIVGSFQADRISGTKQARLRGRLYLPTPSNEIVVSGGKVKWDPSLVALVNSDMTATKAGLNGDGCHWAVYSPTLFAVTHNLATAMHTVTNGWTDDEPDIQRRRGNKLGIRTTWS